MAQAKSLTIYNQNSILDTVFYRIYEMYIYICIYIYIFAHKINLECYESSVVEELITDILCDWLFWVTTLPIHLLGPHATAGGPQEVLLFVRDLDP